MDYFNWVNLYPNYVVLEKIEDCYRGIGNSAYVLNDLMHVPIYTGDYGHVTAEIYDLEEVKNVLTERKISFLIIENGEASQKKFFPDSSYSPYAIANYIKSNVEKTIQQARVSAKKTENKNSAHTELNEKIKLLEGMEVTHKNEALGSGRITKAYLSDKGEIYAEIKFTNCEDIKSFVFIYCTENGLIKLSDENILNEIKELYKKAK